MLHPPNHFHGWGPENPNGNDSLNSDWVGLANDNPSMMKQLADSLGHLIQEAWYGSTELKGCELLDFEEFNPRNGRPLPHISGYYLHTHDPKPHGSPGFKRYVRISPQQRRPNENQFFISTYFPGYTRHLNSGGRPDDRSADITPPVEANTIAITAGFALGSGEDHSDLIDALEIAMSGYERLNPCGQQYSDVKHKASWLLHRQDTTEDEWDESIVAGMLNIGFALRNHWEEQNVEIPQSIRPIC